MTPQAQTRNAVVAAAVLVLVLIIAYFSFFRSADPIDTPSSGATSTSSSMSTSSTALSTSTSLGVTGEGNFTVQGQNQATLNVSIPNASRKLVFGASVTPELRVTFQQNADKIAAEIVKTPNDMRLWINLGTVRRTAGDYEGARLVWAFVAAVAPSNAAAFFNLGNLYGTDLKQYENAEINYKKAIQLLPTDTNPYRSLFEIYSTVYKTGTAAAENILKDGIKSNPRAVDLQVMLARYDTAQGRTADARIQYDAAIANARAQGNTALAGEITTERDR